MEHMLLFFLECPFILKLHYQIFFINESGQVLFILDTYFMPFCWPSE